MANFCPSCGKKLNPTDAFCSGCGKKLSEDNKNQPQKVDNKLEPNAPKVEMPLYGYKVDLSDILKELSLNRQSNALAEEITNGFYATYKEFGDLETVVKNLPGHVKYLYTQAAEFYIKKFREKGVYHISTDDFLKAAESKMKNFTNEFAFLPDVLKYCRNEKSKGELYRQIRKDSRGRVVGGGFGLTGAVQGMAIAGAANMATGLAHSVYNVMEGFLDNMSINDRMDKVYEAAEPGLHAAIKADIRAMLPVYLSVADPEFEFTLTESSQKRYRNIKAAIDADEVPDDDFDMNFLYTIIYLCNEPETYMWAYNIVGDENGELEAFARKLGFSEEADKIKQKRKEDSALNEMFGDDLSAIMEKHKYNHFFQHLVKNGLKGSLLDMAASMYNAAYSSDFESDWFMFVAFDQNDKYLQKVKKSCAKDMLGSEAPIFMIDLSGAIFESSRWEKALLITDKNIRFNGGSIPLRNIDKIGKDDGAFSHNIIINEQKISVPIRVWDKVDSVLKYIEAFIDIVKYLPADRKKVFVEIAKYQSDDGAQVKQSNDNIVQTPHSLSSLQNLISQILNADKKLSGASAIYFCGRGMKDNSKIDKAIYSYAVKLSEDELPLCCYDDTFFGSASQGFILTSQKLYWRNDDSQKCSSVALEDITDIAVSDKSIRLCYTEEKKFIHTTYLSGEERERAVVFLQIMINWLLPKPTFPDVMI